MILSGEKKEEYREINQHYEKHFQNIFCAEDGKIMGYSKHALNELLGTDLVFGLDVRFRNGYSTDSPSFLANCILCIGKGKPEWGAEPDKEYYILKINKIMRDE